MINITVAQVTQMIPKEMKQDMILKHSVQDIANIAGVIMIQKTVYVGKHKNIVYDSEIIGSR
jgi:hypothetical protein